MTLAASGVPARRPAEAPAGAERGEPILRAASPSTAHPGPDLSGTTVLIVDDDVRNVFALTSALEMHGLEVLYADNGLDGIALLTEHLEVRIVLMDAMMPDLDGNATTRRIRALPQWQDLPIVFLTAKAMPGTGSQPGRGRHRLRHQARRPRRKLPAIKALGNRQRECDDPRRQPCGIHAGTGSRGRRPAREPARAAGDPGGNAYRGVPVTNGEDALKRCSSRTTR